MPKRLAVLTKSITIGFQRVMFVDWWDVSVHEILSKEKKPSSIGGFELGQHYIGGVDSVTTDKPIFSWCEISRSVHAKGVPN